MQTFENNRIRVTVSDDVAAKYYERSFYLAHIQGTQTHEQILRGLILSDAMSILGNASELEILEALGGANAIRDMDIENTALDMLTYEYLAEHCRYNLSETLMRMAGGHRMSEGMEADVYSAKLYAVRELTNNPKPAMGRAEKTLKYLKQCEINYRRAKSSREGFEIEIIGPMPEHIGLCRFDENLVEA
jgi:hypothetical protein